jgi:hypothetical protein
MYFSIILKEQYHHIQAHLQLLDGPLVEFVLSLVELYLLIGYILRTLHLKCDH